MVVVVLSPCVGVGAEIIEILTQRQRVITSMYNYE